MLDLEAESCLAVKKCLHKPNQNGSLASQHSPMLKRNSLRMGLCILIQAKKKSGEMKMSRIEKHRQLPGIYCIIAKALCCVTSTTSKATEPS